MFNKDKKKVNEANTKYEEMEVAEEFGDGWFVAGVVTGVAAGAIIVLTYLHTSFVIYVESQ